MKRITILFLLCMLVISAFASCGKDNALLDSPEFPSVSDTTDSNDIQEKKKETVEFESVWIEWKHSEYKAAGTENGPVVQIFKSKEDLEPSEEVKTYYAGVLDQLALYDEDFFAEKMIVCISDDMCNCSMIRMEAADVYKYVNGDAGEIVFDMKTTHTEHFSIDELYPYAWRTVFVILDKDIEIDADKITLNWQEVSA